MLQLRCPSCGGNLEVPEDLETAHCMYCGTKILIQESERPSEKVQLKRFIDLEKASFSAQNYEEAIGYCNKILEIDPNHVDTWIDKAISTFWLTTGARNRYDESNSYLDRALSIDPENERITQARRELTASQALWLNSLGIDSLKHAREIYEIFDSGGVSSISLDGFASKAEDVAKARQESRDIYIEAMNFFVNASEYSPENLTILNNINICFEETRWIGWTGKVGEKLHIRNRILERDNAIKNLPKLNVELQSAQKKLDELKARSGLFSGMKIGSAEREIYNLKQKIASLEEAASYQPPT